MVGVHPLVYHLPNADIDEDGITDIDEMDPVNSTTDSVRDYVAIYGDNQSMMDSQFNPFIRENSPPVILNVKIKKHDHWGICFALFVPYPCLKRAWTDVNVEAIDVAQFTVTIKLNDDSRRSVTVTGKGHEWFQAKLDLNVWDVLVRYKVTVSMVDFAGNKLDPAYTEEVDGLFGGVLRFLEALWDFLVSLASMIADAVMAALSFLIDLIVQAIRAIIDPILDAIEQAVTSFQNSLIFSVQSLFEEHSKSKAESDERFAVDALISLIETTDFMIVVMMVFSTLEMIEEFTGFALAWMHAIVAIIAGIVLTLINGILWTGLAPTDGKSEVSSEYFHTVADGMDSTYWKGETFKRTVMSVVWKYFTKQLSRLGRPFAEFSLAITLTMFSMAVSLISLNAGQFGLDDGWKGTLSLISLVLLMLATGYYLKNLFRASTKFAIVATTGIQLTLGYSMFLLSMARLL